MEKIYMGDNNGDKNSQQQVGSKYHASIVLSFLVAIFAIVALIAVGFNQVSYAAPDDTVGAAATLKLAAYGIKVAGESEPHSLWVRSVKGNQSFPYAIMYEDKGTTGQDGKIIDDINNINILFCYGNESDPPGFGSTYSDQGVIDDAGVSYILNRSGITGNGVTSGISGLAKSDENYRYLEAYATQLSLWLYLNRMGKPFGVTADTQPSLISSFDFVTSLQDITYDLYATSPTTYNKTLKDGSMYGNISNVVTEAKTAKTAGSPSAVLKVNIADPDHVSKVDGTNYFQSSEITVTAADLVKFSLEISGVEGAFVVDENGEEIKNLNELPASTKFFIRFPEDKVKERADILIKATGEVGNVAIPHLYKYDNSHQQIIKIERGTGPATGSNILSVVPSPDTGTSTSQTIYFIGLIVLLCGVGIIYANSKAVKGA